MEAELNLRRLCLATFAGSSYPSTVTSVGLGTGHSFLPLLRGGAALTTGESILFQVYKNVFWALKRIPEQICLLIVCGAK